MEVPVDEVVRRLGRLALIRAVAPGAPGQRFQPVRRHQPHDALRRHDNTHASQPEPHPSVPIAAQAVLEHVAHQGEQPLVPVRPVHRVRLAVVRAARQADPGEQPTHGTPCPAPTVLTRIAFSLLVRLSGSAPRSYARQLHRPLEDRQLDLDLPFLPAQPLQLRARPITFRGQFLQTRRVAIMRRNHIALTSGRILAPFHLAWPHWNVLRHRLGQQLTLPGFSRPTPPRPPRPRSHVMSRHRRPSAPPPCA